MSSAYYWHEDPALKNLYEAEMQVLRGGLGGDFRLDRKFPLASDTGRITAIGWLKFGQNKLQAVRIVFPTRYPYAAPKVIALKTDATGKLLTPLQPHLFGKGNQYLDGSLCLLRSSLWDRRDHNIGWILRRAQAWLTSAHSPTGFKLEEVVEERPADLPHTGQVLMPHDFTLPANLKTGVLNLTQFKENHYILEQNVLPCPTFSLTLGVEPFKWYAFDKGVTFKNLFPVLSPTTLTGVFQKHFNENIIAGAPVKNMALYIPDDSNPWHFFKLHIERSQQVANINVQYYISRNIDRELYLRAYGLLDIELLKTKKVTVIGLGALGSEVAKSLARNAVGHFNLFDSDTFEIGNSIRHAADLFYIGEPKVEVVRQLILRSNPNISVNACNLDVLNDTGLLDVAIAQSDLCIVLTAEDAVDYMLNDIYVRKYPIPFIFARVSKGALSGAVQVVQHQQTACLRCLSMAGVDTLPVPATAIELPALPPEYGSCSAPPLPGSEIDTKEVALQVTRLALQLMLKGKGAAYPTNLGSQYFWHGPVGSETHAPFAWQIENFKIHPDCEHCNNKD